MAKAGVKLDKSVVDGLWACFVKYQPSKTNSIQGTTAIHDAILAVKDPSYADKAIIAIKAPVVLDDAAERAGHEEGQRPTRVLADDGDPNHQRAEVQGRPRSRSCKC